MVRVTITSIAPPQNISDTRVVVVVVCRRVKYVVIAEKVKAITLVNIKLISTCYSTEYPRSNIPIET